MDKINEKLTPKKHKAITALLTHGEVKRAAQEAGISRECLYLWLKDPDFQAALRAAEEEALQCLSRHLAGLAEKAATVLEHVLDDPTERSSLKVKTADIILSKVLLIKDLVDFEKRLSELEEKINAK